MSPLERAVLDTSVVIDPHPGIEDHVVRGVVSTVTLAELAFGMQGSDPVRAVARQRRYEQALKWYEPLPFTEPQARIYGALCDAVRLSGRNPRGRRFDLMIAAAAAHLSLPLITRNPADFEGLHESVRVIGVT